MDFGSVKPVFIIPAFNDDSWLKDTLIQLDKVTKKLGITAERVVVDDGSKDNTSEVALKAGCDVIRFEQNRGKANAVFAGMKNAIKSGADCVMLLDADILSIPEKQLSEVLRLTSDATRSRKILMTISPWKEKNEGGPTIPLSGIRGFSIPAVQKVLSNKMKGAVIGYGLEYFLNYMFTPKQTKIMESNEVFMGREALFKPGSAELQRLDLESIRATLQKKSHRRKLMH